MTNYFLPSDYTHNEAVTFDQGETEYWDEDRLRTSSSYQAAAYRWAEQILRGEGLARIADVGCGAAAKLAALHARNPHIETVGYDQPNAIKFCRQHYTFGRWHPIDLDVPGEVEPQAYDLIVCSDVVEHLAEPDNLLDVLKQLSGEDTLVLLTTPERERLRGKNCRHSPNRYHVREWSEKELRTYLEDRGWRILEHRILPAFKLISGFFLSRACRRWLRGQSIRYNQAVLMKRPAE